MVSGVLDFLWLVPALPLLGVILNGAIALLAERPLLLKEAAHEGEGHGTSPHGASSHGADAHGGHGDSHAPAAYRKLVAFIGPAVVAGAFLISLLSVLELAARAP
ncbi:MAG TPA: hypothetical protein VH660_06600, partial [Candidatus Deferrimicrobiaceae bacterium]